MIVALRGSLPDLGGRARLSGLRAAVIVERDARGIPRVQAQSRVDLLRATGYLHAQDRYFQMDLLRRSAAGELAALFGSTALPADEYLRVHGFRARARAALAAESPEHVAWIQAYAEGVNAGLHSLRSRPFEYWLLWARPEPWRAEDCLLVVYAMYLDLQEGRNQTDATREALRQALPPAMMRLLLAEGSPWDAPLVGGPLPSPPLPTSEELNAPGESLPLDAASPAGDVLREGGSNAMAIAGGRSASGVPILANDMHLNLRVPNIWYPMRWEWRDEGRTREALGMTLPGAPAVVIGSNGRVAWGFTNSYVDGADLVELVDADSTGYEGAAGRVAFERREEIVEIKGEDAVTLELFDSEFGPVVDDGQRAVQWVAHEEGAVNFRLMELVDAGGLDDALEILHESGVPALNVLLASSDGRIAWTLAGRLPRRSFDGRFSVRSDDPRARWRGFHPANAIPTVLDPEDGVLWSANMRHVCCEDYELVGNGGYSLSARATQIRDALRPMGNATEEDLLALQLDDRALFLSRWRERLLDHLERVGADASVIARVRDDSDHASVDSEGYGLVRAFRVEVHRLLLDAWTRPAAGRPGFDRRYLLPQVEEAVWRALDERSAALLPAEFESWPALVAAAWDSVGFSGSWGERNRLQMRHPLSGAVPFLSGWLDMPADPLPGDSRMPRVQSPSFGASERLVISPGREEDAIFHMPGGVSGHPLSPFYGAGHADWVRGTASPFLGEAEHRLELRP